MIDAGILGEGDAVELLEGVLVTKMPKKPRHPVVVRLLADAIQSALPRGAHVRSQDPVTLDDGEPEPDGAVVRGEPRDYLERHPGPRDVLLVIEVADTSLDRDRGIKLRSYARAGIAAYWIVNLVEGVVEVYTRPGVADGVPTYVDRAVRRPGEEVALAIDGGAVVRVDAILP